MELKELTNFTVVLFFLCPGLVFVYISRTLSTGEAPAVTKDSIGGVIALSVLYAVIGLALHLVPSVLLPHGPLFETLKATKRWWLFVYALGGPALLGATWGILMRNEAPFRLAQRLGLHPFHPQPTAWSTAFSRLRGGEFMIVTLNDGAMVKGYFEGRSCISHDGAFRDIFLEETLPPPGQAANAIRGTWISPAEIKLIEVVSRRPPPPAGP